LTIPTRLKSCSYLSIGIKEQCNKCIDFNKVGFLHEVHSIQAKIFKKGTILSAWEKSGHFLFNPEIILQKLPARPQTLPPIEGPLSSSLTPLPHTPSSTIIYSLTMHNQIAEGQGITKLCLDRYIRGSVAQSLALRHAKWDI
jgi:hypothetical protein